MKVKIPAIVVAVVAIISIAVPIGRRSIPAAVGVAVSVPAMGLVVIDTLVVDMVMAAVVVIENVVTSFSLIIAVSTMPLIVSMVVNISFVASSGLQKVNLIRIHKIVLI